MKLKNLLIAAFATGVLLTGQVMAAEGSATKVDGKVLFQKQGSDKFNPASAGIDFNNGDKFMVMDGAKAELTYKNGCKESITGPKVVTIDNNECKAAVVAAAATYTGADMAGVAFASSVAVGVGVVLLSP